MAKGERSEHDPRRKVGRDDHIIRSNRQPDNRRATQDWRVSQLMGDDSPESHEAFDQMYGNISDWDDPFGPPVG